MLNIEISTDKEKLDINLIIDFLHKYSYWAQHRSDEIIKKSIENSYSIGVYREKKQIGFARIVTDYSTVYYLTDIFIIPGYQNRGIGHKLMNYIHNLDFIKNSRGILTTQTAHKFYNEFGFSRENDIVQKRIMVKSPDHKIDNKG